MNDFVKFVSLKKQIFKLIFLFMNILYSKIKFISTETLIETLDT